MGGTCMMQRLHGQHMHSKGMAHGQHMHSKGMAHGQHMHNTGAAHEWQVELPMNNRKRNCV